MASRRHRWAPLDVTNDVNNGGSDDDSDMNDIINGGGSDDDSDIQLQKVLYNSAQLYNNSRQLQETDIKKKGIDMSCQLVKTNGRINLQNSTHEKGEPSCVYCTICNEPRPVSDDRMKRGGCRHVYCEECIINYVRDRIKENLTEVKCPVSDCKEKIVINDYFVPSEFRNQWRATVREAKALASCYIIECPFLDCTGYLIDDKKGFLIRACPKCWTLFCVRCEDHWHMGMDCETYQLKRKIRSLPMIFSSKKDDKKDEGDDDQPGDTEVLTIKQILKLL